MINTTENEIFHFEKFMVLLMQHKKRSLIKLLKKYTSQNVIYTIDLNAFEVHSLKV